MVVTTVWAVGRRGGAAAWDWSGVATLWASRVLAPICRTSMVKRTKGARGVGLLAALGGMAKAITVVALGVPVGVEGFFDLELLGEEQAGRHEGLNVLGVD